MGVGTFGPREGYEEFAFIGWNDACSAAFQHIRYPALGKGLQGEPAWGRIGTVTFLAGREKPKEAWALEQGSSVLWNRSEANAAVDDLIRGGYAKAGHVETVRPEPVAGKPGLEALLRTAQGFDNAGRKDWAPAPFALSKVFYSPLGNCALLLFQRPAAAGAYRYSLVRLSPSIRRTRARAHLTNGLILYRQGNLDGGVAECAIAASTDPGYPLARYYHAVMLAGEGRFDESLDELKAAVAGDPRLKKNARAAPEFEDLMDDGRFTAIVGDEEK